MLNKNSERELAYLVKIDDIKSIEGKDRVECAVVGGWAIMVRKDQFKPGDIGIYFEIDSKCPEKEPFMFLEQKHFKIKTQKYKTPSGQFWSQGLLMHPSDFGWDVVPDAGFDQVVRDSNGNYHHVDDESRFLTKELEVTYYDPEDNARKSNPNSSKDKYGYMVNKHRKFFKSKIGQFVLKHKLTKNIAYLLVGKKPIKKSWPSWVAKTDEERVQNMPWILNDKSPWVATEKIDGTSTTFTMKRTGKKKFDFYVCSRNVVFDKPDKKCFYETNVYTEMAEKYGVEEVLRTILNNNTELEWVTLQGETYGAGVQKRDYSMKDSHDFAGFNLIDSNRGRWNSVEARDFIGKYGIPWVPILDTSFILPDTVEELLEIATDNSVIDGKEREGIVFRSQDGAKSFKVVSNEFLARYHNG